MELLTADEIGFTRKSCTGFGVDSNAYLFWKVDSLHMMQKIEFIEYPKEHLKEYKPINITNDIFFNSFLKNREEILTDSELKRFRLEVKENNESGVVSTSYPMTSHSCYRLIRIKSKNTNLIKDFNYFNLAKNLGNSKDKPNINFDFNKNLGIVKFDELLNSQIKEIENGTEFELINRE